MSQLFDPLTLRGVRFKNRVFVSPMCQYSCGADGLALSWHLVNLGRYAVGGAALVFTEATAVSAAGRITPNDLGLWSDAHADALRPIVAFLKSQGAVPGVQLAHAGRKASTAAPWHGGGKVAPSDGGWTPVAPSAVASHPRTPSPRRSTRAASQRSFKTSSPLRSGRAPWASRSSSSTPRTATCFISSCRRCRTTATTCGGATSIDVRAHARRRVRHPRRVARGASALRAHRRPTGSKGGAGICRRASVSRRTFASAASTSSNCSSGGNVLGAEIPVGPGYQVPFAKAVREEARVATGAVGLITDPAQANDIVASGSADAVLLARELMRDPNWALHAARALGVDVPWPVQHERRRETGLKRACDALLHDDALIGRLDFVLWTRRSASGRRSTPCSYAADLAEDERVEVPRSSSSCASPRSSTSGRRRPPTAAPRRRGGRHVRRVRVLRDLAPHDLPQAIHAARGDGEDLDPAVRRFSIWPRS